MVEPITEASTGVVDPSGARYQRHGGKIGEGNPRVKRDRQTSFPDFLFGTSFSGAKGNRVVGASHVRA